jgi:hypothetical protein
LRDTLERHLLPSDLPAAKRGPRGAIGRMLEKAERFAPGAGRKYHAKADSDYTQAVVDGNVERDETGEGAPSPSASASGVPETTTGSSAP